MKESEAARAVPEASSRGSKSAGVFVFRFIVLLAGFYAFSALPWFRESLMPRYLTWSAWSGSFLLQLLGEQTQVVGLSIVSPRFALSVFRGCDGIDAAALFVSAVLAFQAPWLSRLTGLLAGVAFLVAANAFRIISLYYVGALRPDLFELAHVDIWQPLFVIVVALTFVTWAKSASRSPPTTSSHAHR